jgi:hypothetical protein
MTSPQGEVPIDQVLLQTRRDLVTAFQEIYRLQERVARLERRALLAPEVVVTSQADEGGPHGGDG